MAPQVEAWSVFRRTSESFALLGEVAAAHEGSAVAAACRLPDAPPFTDRVPRARAARWGRRRSTARDDRGTPQPPEGRVISARLVRARFAAAAPALIVLLAVVCLCAAGFATILEDQAEREARAARAERWAFGPLRPERALMRSAKLRQPEDVP